MHKVQYNLRAARVPARMGGISALPDWHEVDWQKKWIPYKVTEPTADEPAGIAQDDTWPVDTGTAVV